MSNSFPIIKPNYSNDYGFPWEKILGSKHSQWERELLAYRMLSGKDGKRIREQLGIDGNMSQFGLKDAFYHMCIAFQLCFDQSDFSLYSIVGGKTYVNTYALKIIKAWCDNDALGVAGSASTGKTYAVAGCILIDWYCAPQSTLTLVGSTSIESLDDRIWKDIKRLHRASRYRYGTLVDYKRCIVHGQVFDEKDEREYEHAIKAVAIKKGEEGKKVAEDLRGRKGDRVRLVYDEMAEMDMYVTDPCSNLSSNPDFKFVGIANPQLGRNPHYRFCLPKGMKEFPPEHKNWEGWETEMGYCVFCCGERSPNMLAPVGVTPPFPRLTTRDSISHILKWNGGNKNSINYWRDAIGGWPGAGISQTVMSPAALKKANVSVEPFWDGSVDKVKCAALDPSFTADGDNPVLTLGFIGMQTSNSGERDFTRREAVGYNPRKKVGYVEKQITLHPDASGDFIEALAKETVRECIAYGVKPINFGIDVSNDGGKVAQAIIREWMKTDPSAINIYLISSQGAPSDRSVSEVDSRPCSEVYDRKVSEYWFAVATAIETRCLYGVKDDMQMTDELCARSYVFKGRRQSVITKDDFKAILGHSCDHGDSLSYLVEMFRRAGLSFVPDDAVDIPEYNDIRDGRYSRDRKPVSSLYSENNSYESDDWGEG